MVSDTESNIHRVDSLEVANITVKSEVEDAPMIPRFCTRYKAICES